MSLVNDALKKAQREAAAREARDKGLPEPLAASPAQPFRSRGRRRSWTSSLALTLTLIAIAILVATLYRVLGRESDSSPLTGRKSSLEGKARPAERPLPARAGVGEAAVPGAGAEAGSAGEIPDSVPSPAETAAPASGANPATEHGAELSGLTGTSAVDRASRLPPSSALAPDAATAPPSMAAVRNVSPTPSDASSRPETDGRGSQTRPAAARQPAESFVREAVFDDGRVLRLGGIAWSETAPLAYLNGRLLGVGESIEGWTLTAIARGHVALQRGGNRLTIRLK